MSKTMLTMVTLGIFPLLIALLDSTNITNFGSAYKHVVSWFRRHICLMLIAVSRSMLLMLSFVLRRRRQMEGHFPAILSKVYRFRCSVFLDMLHRHQQLDVQIVVLVVIKNTERDILYVTLIGKWTILWLCSSVNTKRRLFFLSYAVVVYVLGQERRSSVTLGQINEIDCVLNLVNFYRIFN